MRKTVKIALMGLLGLGVAACTTAGTTDPLAGARLAPPPIDFKALLTHPDRPTDDFKDDRSRQPADVLAFAGLEYGMTVVEVEAGSGYYTELLSHGAGAEGRVYMQNPVEFDAFFGEQIIKRTAGRLANVEQIRAPFDQLAVGTGEADLVTWFLGPHELWFRPDGAPKGVFGEPEKAFAEIVRVMKPGANFVVIDHAAAAGASPQSGNETHRIDPDIVLQYAVEVGLVLVERSDMLANPDDDGTLSVFDPSLRRNTNRFIYKFRKAQP